MPEDSQTQPDSSQATQPVEPAASAPEVFTPIATEATQIEQTQVPSEPIATVPPETPQVMAQIPGNEPFDTTHDKPLPAEPAPAPVVPSVPLQEQQPVSVVPTESAISVSPPITTEPLRQSPKSLLAKAMEAIRFRKKAKLEKIMKLAQEKRSITNDQVQKLLRVSDATATRYLSELVRQTRLRRFGIRGSARYEPTIGSIPTI